MTEADQISGQPDPSNQMTVEDMGWLLDAIYDCAYNESGPLIDNFDGAYEPRECRQILHVMSNNDVDALLRTGVPADTRVAHKHGWVPDTHGNAAIFFTDGGNYAIVAMLHQPTWLDFGESLPLLSEISRFVYNVYNPDETLPAIREGYIPEAASCNFTGSQLVTDLRQPVWDE